MTSRDVRDTGPKIRSLSASVRETGSLWYYSRQKLTDFFRAAFGAELRRVRYVDCSRLLALALLLLAPALHAQSLEIGGAGGYAFSNYTLGPALAGTVPLKRLSVGGYAEYDPALTHTALGRGYGDLERLDTWVRLGRGWRTYLAAERSAYHAADVHKTQRYVRAGFSLDSFFMDLPARYTFMYVREADPRFLYGGTESSNLQSGIFRYEWRWGRAHFWQEIQVGGVRPQGNPVCDQTPVCPRRYALSGGTISGLTYVLGKTE